ncbi:ion transporter [Patescibacteria group bacterium]|nr:ion transporter [Patescibacteria group bacterium]
MLTLSKVVQHAWFDRFVMGVIAVNAITLALETYPQMMAEFGNILTTLDGIFITFFIMELILRLLVYRRTFFADGWRWFDLSIVVLTTLPLLGVSALGNVSAFRALRLLRLLSAVPAFRRVFAGIIRALRDSAAVMGVLALQLSIFAIVASKLFGSLDPEHFGNLHTAMFTLFQMMTLDAWSDIVRPLAETSMMAIPFFVSFIVVVVFILLSTIIGIAANAMGTTKD